MDDTDLRKIIERNKRVEADKAWETSWSHCTTRRGGSLLPE